MKGHSLTSRILGLMIFLILLSSGLSIFALANLWHSLGDAKSINASGSLRMQSYRLMLDAGNGDAATTDKLQEFDATLNSPALKRSLAWDTPSQLKQQYLLVVNRWQQMKSYIEQQQPQAYRASLTDFVDTIDLLVRETEHYAAFKLKMLALSQLIGLGLMLSIAVLAVRYTRRKVVAPLQQLMQSANTIATGHFEVNLPHSEYIELQALTDALDRSAKELSSLYQGLEAQVQEKTRALTRTHQELHFLYNNLVMLHGNRLDYQTLRQALNQLKEYERLDYLRLHIRYEDGTDELIEADGGWPPGTQASCHFPLTLEQSALGFLEIASVRPPNQPLLEHFAIMLARSIQIRQSAEQRQQLALMEERGVIARELHDSLGQMLSFLKIQISLLRKGLTESCRNPGVEEQLNEINQGINSAYSQLRELLSTFRLTIKEPNLQHALEAMLEQLRSQSDCHIHFDYAISEQLLGADQHIHILQLTREATLNAIKHAKASDIEIKCCKNAAGLINISISDNGIGIQHLRERDRHFGIAIMHERAAKLGGELSFSGNAAGGTLVTLTLPPLQEPSHHG